MSNKDYAKLPIWPQADTPCVGYCSTNLGDSLCMGCGRTVEEVDSWLFKTDEEKAQVWQRIMAAGVGYRWQGQQGPQG